MTVEFFIEITSKELGKERIRELFNKMKSLHLRIDLIKASFKNKLIDEYIYEIDEENFVNFLNKSDELILTVVLEESHPKFNKDNFEIDLFVYLYKLRFDIEDFIVSEGVSESLKIFLKMLKESFSKINHKAIFLCDDDKIFSGKFDNKFLHIVIGAFDEFRKKRSKHELKK